MRIHYIQHVSFEDPAYILQWAGEKGLPVKSTRLYLHENFPDAADFDFLLIMGGPMGANDEGILPWLKEEKRFIENAIHSGKIVIGICLGSQLIASVLGAQVIRNPEKEIGWFPVSFINQVLVMPRFLFPPEIMAFHWHGETFDLPHGSILLASSQAYVNQAFQYGSSVFGFQFHLEANAHSVDQLIKNCPDDLVSSPFIQTAQQMTENIKFSDQANTVMGAFLDYLLTGFRASPAI